MNQDLFSLSEEGVISLNKEHPLHDEINDAYINSILPLKNRQLKRAIKRMEAVKRDAILEMTLALMKLEQARRLTGCEQSG